MSKNHIDRIKKFEKIIRVQENRLGLLKQQIAWQAKLVEGLRKECEGLEVKMQVLPVSSEVSQRSIAYWQQLNHLLAELQKQVNVLRAEIASADEKLDYLHHSYREEERVLRSWEKLVEGKKFDLESVAAQIEQRQADDLFLMHDMAGDDQ